MSYESTHQKFLEAKRESEPYVLVAKRWMQSLGYFVTNPPTTEAERHEDWEANADHGDLQVARIFIGEVPLPEKFMRIEVKHMEKKDFTGDRDWPYGRSMLVCAKHAFDRAQPRVHAVCQFSKNLKTVAVVLGDTSPRWFVRNTLDGRPGRGTWQLCYRAPLELVRFFPVRI